MAKIDRQGLRLIRLGAVVCALGVMFGAFGAHWLEGQVGEWYEPERALEKLSSWETGVRYQLFHGLGLMLAGLIPGVRFRRGTAVCFLVGLIAFSGCLYGWVLLDWKPLVVIVPIGGMAFIAGWLLLAYGSGSRPVAKVDSQTGVLSK